MVKTFTRLCGAKFPKAVKKVTDDEAELLAFSGFPAQHRIHLRTTNPIESTFATVRAADQGHPWRRLPHCSPDECLQAC